MVNSDGIKEAIDKYTLTEDVRLVTSITPGDSEVTVRYKDTDMYVTSSKTDDGGLILNAYDDSNHVQIPFEYDPGTGLIVTQDEFYKDLSFSTATLNDGKL